MLRPLRPIDAIIAGMAIVIIVILTMQAIGAELSLPSGSHRTPRPILDPRCNTAARYDAMREAYDKRLPDPCNGAKSWRP